jgi:phosphoribosylanthranilate isomerase
MRVKICGITRPEDAWLAAELGAWAVGFVFWPGSPRCVSPATAREIARRIAPFCTPVGVFVDQPLDEIEAIAAEVGLGAVQLHGSEPIQIARSLGRPIIRGLGLRADCEQDVRDWCPHATVLLDAHDPIKRGGTGTTTDWPMAARIAAGHRIILAGGLRPDNVREAVTRVRPAAIDVSSGVESAPGIKDSTRVRALFAALEGVEAAL